MPTTDRAPPNMCRRVYESPSHNLDSTMEKGMAAQSSKVTEVREV